MTTRQVVLLAIAAVLVAFTLGGVYSITRTGDGAFVRVNRFTGDAVHCDGLRGCEPVQ